MSVKINTGCFESTLLYFFFLYENITSMFLYWHTSSNYRLDFFLIQKNIAYLSFDNSFGQCLDIHKSVQESLHFDPHIFKLARQPPYRKCCHSRHIKAFKGIDRDSLFVCEMTSRYAFCITPLHTSRKLDPTFSNN